MNLLGPVAIGGAGLVVLVAVADVWCLWTGRPTPGQVIQLWSREHPFYSFLLCAFVGAFAAHIYWHR